MATEARKTTIIDGMVHGTGEEPDFKWAPNTITVCFAQPQYAGSKFVNPLGENAQQAFRAACTLWENVADIHFVFVTDPSQANIVVGYGPSGYDRGVTEPPPEAGDPQIGTSNSDITLEITRQADFEKAAVGEVLFRAMVHELGHALGLDHPHDPSDGDSPIGDNSLYSIMAKGVPEGIGEDGTPDRKPRLPNESPMVWDILAIQQLYGPNTSYNSQDNSYIWTSVPTHYQAIWDTDGIDTIYLANQKGKAEINLSENDNGGGEVKIKNENGQVTLYVGIAFDTTIENATGTDQDDSITGNDAANVLMGMKGNDTLNGGKGDDTLEGGEGIDTYIINDGDGHDRIIDEGQNRIIYNGKLIAGVFKQDDTNPNKYNFISDDKTWSMSFHSPGVLTFDAETSLQFMNQTSAADFADHDFGITLMEDPPETTLTLTGHSLGGGLAALVGVFFGVETVAFDQAPFAKSAKAASPVANDILTYLQNNIVNNVYTDPKVIAECTKAISALQGFIQQRTASGGIPNTGIVKTISVEGELNSFNWPFNEFEIIGPPAEVLTHGGGNISGIDFPAGTGLHSQALLTILLMSDQAGGKTLRQVSEKLPGLFTDNALHTTADNRRWRFAA